MEPQLIDYYNDEPHGVNVIDKLEEEYEEAMAKIKQLEEERDHYKYNHPKLKRFTMPKFKVSSVEEYKKYNRAIKLLEENVSNLLENAYGDVELDNKILIDRIIDELNKLTEYQNGEWAKHRVLYALEIGSHVNPYDKAIVIMGYIMGDADYGWKKNCLELNDITHKFTGWDGDDICRTLNLHKLCYYNCEKCGKEDYNGGIYNMKGDELNTLLCMWCMLENLI